MYYVIPDIHGMNSLLQKALQQIYKDNPNGGKIIFLGDYIDRGPENVEVLLTVMNPPEKWEFIPLMGNHEDMFIGSYRRTSLYGYYDHNTIKQLMQDDRLDLDEAVEWMESLSLFHFEGNNVFARAFYYPNCSPQGQIKEQVLWDRFSDNESYKNKQGLYLTHGHTPRLNGPILAPSRCNLDARAVFYEELVVAIFEEGKTGPQDFIRFTL